MLVELLKEYKIRLKNRVNKAKVERKNLKTILANLKYIYERNRLASFALKQQRTTNPDLLLPLWVFQRINFTSSRILYAFEVYKKSIRNNMKYINDNSKFILAIQTYGFR